MDIRCHPLVPRLSYCPLFKIDNVANILQTVSAILARRKEQNRPEDLTAS